MKSRNLPIIDKALLETLCGYQAPLSEIADVMKVAQRDILEYVRSEYDTSWREFYAGKTAIGKSKLRENQFNLAKRSPEMAKYLAEKYLTEEEGAGLQEAIANLTPRKKKFADKLLECEDQTEAAIYAGYSKKTAKVIASQLAKEKWIAEYLRLKRIEDEKRLQISKDKYLQMLDEMAVECIAPADKLGAIKLIGRWQGYEAPTKSAQTNSQGQDVPPQLTVIVQPKKDGEE